MTEQLTPYVPQFWAAETLLTLQNNLVLAGLVHRDFENVVAQEGDTINTRKPSPFTARTKAIGASITTDDAIANNVQVKLDTHAYVSFVVDDVTLATGLSSIVRDFIRPQAQALGQKVDADIYSKMQTSFYYSVGTAGTVPTAISALTGVRKKQNQKMVPFESRNLVIGPTVEDKFLQLDAFIRKDYTSEPDALSRARMGEKFGLTLFMDQNVETTFTSANSDSTMQTDGAATVGASSIGVATNAGGTDLTTAPSVGDLIQITYLGVTDEYIITSSTVSSIGVSPKVRRAYADDTAITVVGRNGSHSRLPFFTKNAISFVNRPLPAPDSSLGVKSFTVNADGISVRALISYDKDKLGIQVTLDMLYGVGALDPELGGFLLS